MFNTAVFNIPIVSMKYHSVHLFLLFAARSGGFRHKVYGLLFVIIEMTVDGGRVSFLKFCWALNYPVSGPLTDSNYTRS